MQDHKLAKLGWSIFKRKPYPVVYEISALDAIWIIERIKISIARYLELRLFLLVCSHFILYVAMCKDECQEHAIIFQGRIILPPYHIYHQEMLTMRPKNLIHLHHGVAISLKEMLTMTLTEILTVIKEKGDAVPLNIAFEFCWGMDGSGDHKDWNQMSKKEYSTKDMFLVVFSLLKIWDELNKKSMLFTTAAKGHNSPTNVRPLAIIPAQETDDLLKEVIPLYEAEIEEMEEPDFRLIIELPGQQIKARMNFQQISMIDGKIIIRITGQTGSYCFNCYYSEEQCHDLLIINSEVIFYITKTIEDMHDIADRLTDSDGQMRKKTRDYEDRQGQCHKPMTRLNVNLVLPATHLKINLVTYLFEKLLPKQNSHQRYHTVTNKGKYTDAEKADFTQARQEMRDFVHEAVGIAFGGSSNKDKQSRGGWFHKFAGDDIREKTVQQLKDPVNQQQKRLDFSEFLLKLYAIVKVCVSLKIQRFKDL